MRGLPMERRPSPPASSRPPRRPDARVPHYASRFFGRVEELAELSELLERSPVVTVVGPGGIGKTRLVAEFCGRRRHAYFVELASCRELEEVCFAVGLALGGTLPAERAGAPEDAASSDRVLGRAETLVRLAQAKLLVLDNAEQAADAVAEVAMAFGRHCRVLVTSRERLNIAGESTLELLPLSESRDGAAHKLLFDRGGHHLRRNERTMVEATTLIRLVEGLPLAIELAASRLGVMPLGSIIERLSNQLDVLSSRRRDLPERHRRMQAALDWSWELLDDDDRAALVALASFQGGFDLASAQAAIGVTAARASELVEGLLDKSLLRRLGGDDEEPRFRSYELVRRYVLDRASELDVDRREVFLRLARHLVHVGEERRKRRRGPGALEDQRFLMRERENLLAIAAEELGDDDLSARALLLLEPFLLANMPAAQHASFLAALDPRDPEVKGRTLLTKARLAGRQRRHRGAEGCIEEACRLTASLADRSLFCEALALRVNHLYMQGQTERACAEGLAGREALGAFDGPVMAELTMEVGVAAHMHGDLEQARSLYAEALRRARSHGHRIAEADTLACVGFLEQDEDRLSEAEERYASALELLEPFDRKDVKAIVEGYLGNLHRRRRDLAAATAAYERALTTLRRIGDRHFEAVVWMDRGLAHLDAGQDAIADDDFKAALDCVAPEPDLLTKALSHAGRSVVAARRGELAEAHAQMSMARDATADDSDPRRPVLDMLSGLIDLAEREHALAEGDEPAADKALERARAKSHAPLAGGFARSDYAHLAKRLLLGALEVAAPPLDAMLVAADGSWLRTGAGTRIELNARESLSAIVAHLARRHRAEGRASTVSELRDAAWPGEAMSAASAKNRVRVAISTLRKLGLAEDLVTVDGGYALRPRSGQLLVVRRDG